MKKPSMKQVAVKSPKVATLKETKMPKAFGKTLGAAVKKTMKPKKMGY